MRMLVGFQMPLEPFISMMREGTAGRVIQQIPDDLKPEVVYFTTREGKRRGAMVTDVPIRPRYPPLRDLSSCAFRRASAFTPA
jgi:hypothetical protein